jgi:hypothetical protein
VPDKDSVPGPKLPIGDPINRKLYGRLPTTFREHIRSFQDFLRYIIGLELNLCYLSEETILESGFWGQDASGMELDAVSHADFMLCYG